MRSPDCVITGLRSVALGVENFDEVLDFYTRLWGLVTVAQAGETAWLASPTDPAAFLLRLRKVAAKRLDLIGLAARSPADVDVLAARLAAADVKIDRLPADLDSPGGGYGLRFFDCDGRLIEVSADVAPRAAGNGNIGGAIKGAPVTLSHVVLNTLDVNATRAFYQDILGFQLSDWLEDRMCFLRCASPKHHIIAIAQGPHVSLNHVAYDVGTIDAQMRATGRLKRAERKLIWGPGRHFIGNNTFSYFIDPAGNVCEFTSELEEITDPDWQPRKVGMSPEFQDQWGTGGLVTDGMIPAQFNTLDQGLWQTSPL